MNNRYKIILSNNNIYKEIELDQSMDQIKIGTAIDCDVRLRKELFFDHVELLIKKNNDNWSLYCSDNLYLSVGDIRKLITKNLNHGDTIKIKYQEYNVDVFDLFFTIDFDYEKEDYNLEVGISKYNTFVIGNEKNANILINDENVGNGNVLIEKVDNNLYITDNHTKYGVHVNGMKIENKKQLKDYDFFSIANYKFYYANGKLFTSLKDNQKMSNNLNVKLLEQTSTHFEYPNFTRSSRIQYTIPEGEIEIQQPIPKIQKPKKNILLTLAPSLLMLVLTVIMRSSMGGGGTFIIYSACSMGIGIAMSIVTYVMDGKEYERNIKKRDTEYREYISKKENEINKSRNKEIENRNYIYESIESSINEVKKYGKRIFEKSKKDKDFLDVYLGKGYIESNIPVKYTKQEFIDTEDELVSLPEKLEKKYHYLKDAPIVSRFNNSNALGIVGNEEGLYNLLKNISLDIAIRHYYKEVKMYYVLNDNHEAVTEWAKWLRHVHNDNLGIRNIICDEESQKVLFENLYSILSYRESLYHEQNDIKYDTYYVVFVLDSSSISKHPISKYTEEGNKYGFTFVYFEKYEELLPKGCNEIVFVNEDNKTARLVSCDDGEKEFVFSYDTIADKVVTDISVKLGGILVQESDPEGEITKNISLYELLNVFSVDEIDLKNRWNTSKVYKSMAAPLGVKTKDEIVYLDISDKANAHGPHGLVAGTTGSGKSEILQTYILSMATLFHPYDVGFVIIDFKGGGMVNQFKDLPHLMGAITNIDGKEINRSLLSIKAELMKRQNLFAQSGVNHINDYIKLFKKGEVKEPLPHLIMIVDEFAELKAEFPDFMKELISAARIGRTLGVHLILATQKPSGVVDNQIWSNSKFRLCLKVQSKEDSNEVIKSPLAADIVQPGRAYLQVGNNEVFDLFQSAYSGAKVDKGNDKSEHIYQIYQLNDWGKKKEVFTNKKIRNEDNLPNQLEALVEHIHSYCSEEHIQQLQGICLPPLQNIITPNDLKISNDIYSNKLNLNVVVGMYDDPEYQIQDNYILNLAENHTYIIGSSQSGKTTLLQTILTQLITHYSPNDVNIYAIDCGNMSLKVYEESRHVGGVVLYQDEERVKNLIKLLYKLINLRKEKLSNKGLGTYNAYVEAGYTDLCRVVVMIDNIASFKEYYQDYDDDLLYFSRECQSLGIHFVVTGTQTSNLGYRIVGNFGNRIALSCVNTDEYSTLFGRAKIVPNENPGRGLCQIDKRVLEYQTILSVEGNKEFIRNENTRKVIQIENSKYPNQKALIIPSVPKLLTIDYLTDLYNREVNNYKIPYAIDYNNVEVQTLDLLELNMLTIMGNRGKTNLVKYFISTLNENRFVTPNEIYILDNQNQKLYDYSSLKNVKEYTIDCIDYEEVISSVHERLIARSMYLTQNRDVSKELYLENKPLIVLLINNKAFGEMFKNVEIYSKFIDIYKEYNDMKVTIIISDLENNKLPAFNCPDYLRQIKENNKYISFDSLDEFRFFDKPVGKQFNAESKPLEIGDAFVNMKNQIIRIKTVLNKEGK